VDSGNLCADAINSSGDLRAARRVLEAVIAQLPAGRSKSAGTADWELRLLVLSRDFVGARKCAEDRPAAHWRTEWNRPWTLGQIEGYLGSKEAAHKLLRQARDLLNAALAKDAKEPQFHAVLADCDARLGLTEEALRDAQSAIDLEPGGKERWISNLAYVNALLGRTDDAVRVLQQLFAMPNTGDEISAWRLKLDPDWDQIRNDPRFQKFCENKLK